MPTTSAPFAARAAWPDWAGAALRLSARQARAEWFGSPFHLLTLRGARPDGPGAAPKDVRPGSRKEGEAILAGKWSFGGETLAVGKGGDPWNRPSPSRPFAETLHAFGWLGDLMAAEEPGQREALRLLLEWRRLFGRWNSFAWSGRILERRTFNLACHLRQLCARASDAESALICDLLARHARQLLQAPQGPLRAAEQAAVVAIAGAALGGEAGDRLMAKALPTLDAALTEAVLADGGHASRSPQAGLELLCDLLALDDGLSQRGQAAPEAMARAIDRLSSALGTLVLPDGRLACFNGGEAGDAKTIAAAMAACQSQDEAPPPAKSLPQSGYERLDGASLTVMVDAGAPPPGAWSETACAQPAAIEVVFAGERLITNCGWSPAAEGPQALRMTSAGSTLSVGDGSAGSPLSGLKARAFGPRLVRGASALDRRRTDTPEAVLVEISHDGWAADWGLIHERTLFLDLKADELRGEDRLVSATGRGGSSAPAAAAIRFHLAPGVKTSLARDGHSVLLQGPSAGGWWLRNDAGEVVIEPSVHFEDGAPRRCEQVVLRGRMAAADGGRVRWKLTRVEPEDAGKPRR